MDTEKKLTLEFDDETDKLYTRHDGGSDTPKGIFKAADYPDYEEIKDKDAAALLVYLDIYRGIPQDSGFVFGRSRYLAKSAFLRMLAACKGRPKKEIFKIARSEGGISFGEALDMVNAMLGKVSLREFDEVPKELPLCRGLASELIYAAFRASDGSGEIPYLYFVEKDASLTELELPKNSVVASPDGSVVTLTVDGVFQPLTGGWKYRGDIKLTVTERYDLYRYIGRPGGPPAGYEKNPDGSWKYVPLYWDDWTEPYRAALYIEDGKKVQSRSIDAACHQKDGRIFISSDGAPSNAYAANDFNGVLVNGTKGGKYEIKNLTVRFDGNSRDDFQGLGAGILLVGDKTETVIENADIINYGTVRSSLVAGGSAKAIVKNSRLETHDGMFEEEYNGRFGSFNDDMRQAPAWGGFEGNCRSTNLLDQAEVNYYKSVILTEKWGVLSTDNNDGVCSTVVNSLVAVTGGLNAAVDTSSEEKARASLEKIPFAEHYGEIRRDLGGHKFASGKHAGGYGTYSIGNTTMKFAGCTVSAADFAAVCANDAASVIYCASKPESYKSAFGFDELEAEVKNTVVYSDKVGVQMHRGNGLGCTVVKEGTVFHSGCTCFTMKTSGAENLLADDSTIISETGVILQMMDEDDLRDGYVEHSPPTAQERAESAKLIEEGKIDVFHIKEGWDSTARFSNMTINGDTCNSSGYTGHITQEDLDGAAASKNDAMARRFGSKFHCENGRNLSVELSNVLYNGVISTSEGFHYDRDTGERMSTLPQEKWYCIGFVENTPRPVYQAGLILLLKDGSVWNLPQTCYLSSLTVDESSRVSGRVFVNGEYTVPAPGVTYEGFITVQPG